MTSRGLADTSLFVAREGGRAVDVSRLPEQLAVSVVTLGELRAGVLAASDVTSRARRLETLQAAEGLQAVSVDTDVAAAWAVLRLTLRDAGRAMKANDSWIAATALALGIPVVTQDLDYDGIGGLEVILV